MKKAMIAAVVVAGLSVAVLGTRSASASPAEGPSELVTQEEVNAVVDARLHELLKQKIDEMHAAAERAADGQ
jgi:hypothetical protein